MSRPALLIVILLLFAQAALGQFIVVPLTQPGQKSVKKAQARIKSDSIAMGLPFWDDFSLSNSSLYPNDSLWQLGHSVSLNDGIGINPPSKGIVTFDGLDSLGQPYNIANPLAKGYADKLVSPKIRLDLIPLDQLDSVFFSFFYQFDGNGEAPDPGDLFTVDFLDSAGHWANEFSVTYDTALKPTKFYFISIKIADLKFFHKDFQFRFRNFGRLSGPYDTWNLDYVYLNTHRSPNDQSVPDRTVYRPMTGLFQDYRSMPMKHFLTDPTRISKPSLGLHNMEYLPGNTSELDVQPVNYTSTDSIILFSSGASSFVTHILDVDQSIGTALKPLEFRDVDVNKTPDFSSVDATVDSAYIFFKVGINSGDNILPNALPKPGDYNPIYTPIDFRHNDTTTLQSRLSNYYAYDDGTAEYGIGLDAPGTEFSYRFDMKTPLSDTIVAVDIYFPRFGDESSQVVNLRILRDLSDTEQSILYEENISVQRSQQNHFIRHPLNKNTVGVMGSFYMGWQQSTQATIAVGWDKNTDTGDRLYFNEGDGWVQNLVEHGSMMFRPVFGKGGIPTGLPEKISANVFPNPSNGTFYIPAKVDLIEVYDMAGRLLTFSSEITDQQTKIALDHIVPGMYVVKTYIGQQQNIQKIIVHP